MTRAALVRRLAISLVLGSAGCAGPRFEGVRPEQIPALEARLAEQGTHPDAGLLASLGEAYFAAGRHADARRTLERAVALDPDDRTAELYLAFALDEAGQYPEARSAYERLLAKRPERAIAGAIEDRRLLLDRKEAVQAAREALAREAALAAEPAPANAIAVLPLRYTGSNPDLKPLERGLAELIITDLGTVARLTLVERLKVQAILDELELAATGRVDSATAARSGRLLRAGRVLQGTISDAGVGGIGLDAALVDATSSGVESAASGQDELGRLFDLEKQVVFGVLDRMGIQLSPAERERIAERPTASVQALLAYSRGLEAQDQGRFDEAVGAFRQAVTLDPNFRVARAAGQLSSQLSRGADLRPGDLAPRLEAQRQQGARGRLREAVARLTPSGGDVAARSRSDRESASDRKGVQEGTDTQGPTDATRSTTVTITVTRPETP